MNSGIYKIQSKYKPKRIYIGSAVDFASRKRVHLCQLRKGNHHSPKLQRHYNKYGENDLIFSFITGCDKLNLIAYEQFYIDSLYPYFNVCQTAGSLLGIKRGAAWNKGKKATSEAIKNQSKAHKGKVPWNKGIKTNKPAWNTGLKGQGAGHKHSEEARNKIRKGLTGNKNALGFHHTEETKQRMSEKAKNRNVLILTC